jgi:hypothetical protein
MVGLDDVAIGVDDQRRRVDRSQRVIAPVVERAHPRRVLVVHGL